MCLIINTVYWSARSSFCTSVGFLFISFSIIEIACWSVSTTFTSSILLKSFAVSRSQPVVRFGLRLALLLSCLLLAVLISCLQFALLFQFLVVSPDRRCTCRCPLALVVTTGSLAVVRSLFSASSSESLCGSLRLRASGTFNITTRQSATS